MRLLVVMMAVVANSMQTRGKLVKRSASSIRDDILSSFLHEQADSTSVVLGGVLQNGQERTRRGRDDGVDVASHEQQNDKEDGSSDGTNADAGNHDLGSFHRRVGNFLNHMSNTVLRKSVDESQEEFGGRLLTNPVTPRPPCRSCLSVSNAHASLDQNDVLRAARQCHQALYPSVHCPRNSRMDQPTSSLVDEIAENKAAPVRTTFNKDLYVGVHTRQSCS